MHPLAVQPRYGLDGCDRAKSAGDCCLGTPILEALGIPEALGPWGGLQKFWFRESGGGGSGGRGEVLQSGAGRAGGRAGERASGRAAGQVGRGQAGCWAALDID